MLDREKLRAEFRAYLSESELNEAKSSVIEYFNKFKNDKYSNINVKKDGKEILITAKQPGLKASIPEIKDLLSYAFKNGYVEVERNDDYTIWIKSQK